MLNYLYIYPEDSQLVIYMRKCVRALARNEQKPANQGGGVENGSGGGPQAVPEELTKLFHRVFEDIFDGVGGSQVFTLNSYFFEFLVCRGAL